MAFIIPNQTGSVEDPTGVYPQAQPDKVDIDILVAALGFTGVVSGCTVTAQGTPNMTVAVASGSVTISGAVPATVTSGNVTITAADGSSPRFDLIVANSSGTKSATAGTPSSNPVFPAIPANSVVLAAVYVPAAATSITSARIIDKRTFIGTAVVPFVTQDNTVVRFDGVTGKIQSSGVTIDDSNNLSANTLISTVSTGTAPLVVASTTVVANLNASFLGGATFAAPGAIGSGTPGSGAFTTLNVSGVTNILGGSSLGLTLRSNTIQTEEYNGPDAISLNYNGYANGTSQFRNLNIFNGKQGLIAVFADGATSLTGTLGVSGAVSVGSYLSLSNGNDVRWGSSADTFIAGNSSSHTIQFATNGAEVARYTTTGGTITGTLDVSGAAQFGPILYGSPIDQIVVSGGVDSGITLRQKTAVNRFRLFVGSTGGSFVADDNYIVSANTDLHFLAGVSGTTETLKITSAGAVTIPGPLGVSGAVTLSNYGSGGGALSTGAADSGGTGYKVLRVPN